MKSATTQSTDQLLFQVQQNDTLPKNVCSECRFQLEQSYCFRLKSKLCDTKLKKHLRLASAGKISRVFEKNPDEEEYYDEEYDKIAESAVSQTNRLLNKHFHTL